MLLNCGVGEDSENPLDCKEIQPVHPEGDQPWDFFGRNDAKTETYLIILKLDKVCFNKIPHYHLI